MHIIIIIFITSLSTSWTFPKLSKLAYYRGARLPLADTRLYHHFFPPSSISMCSLQVPRHAALVIVPELAQVALPKAPGHTHALPLPHPPRPGGAATLGTFVTFLVPASSLSPTLIPGLSFERPLPDFSWPSRHVCPACVC